MLRSIRRLFGDNKAATAVEYAIIAAVIGVAAIAAFRFLGNKINDKTMEAGRAIERNGN